MSVIAIVPAAGSGTRIGSEIPKTLLEIGDVSMIRRTIRTLQSCADIAAIVIVGPKGYLAEFKSEIKKESFSNVFLIPGGATRQDSVYEGISFIRHELEALAPEFLLIHDAARCFVSTEIIEASIEGAKAHDAVTVAVPVVDSIKEVGKAKKVERSLERSKLWSVQTPQVFRRNLLEEAHEAARARRLLVATDDASLVERIHPVHVIEGSARNFKVTTPFDLEVARSIAADTSNGDGVSESRKHTVRPLAPRAPLRIASNS